MVGPLLVVRIVRGIGLRNVNGVSRIADQTVTLDNVKANKVLKIVDRLEELDDVQQVSTNLELPEDFQEEE